MKNGHGNKLRLAGVPKTATGIQGPDEITFGGLPKGRSSLICVGAGCAKALLGLEFLVNGAWQYKEPGVFVAFEESAQELIANVSSLKFDLDKLVGQRLISLDHVRVERSEIEESGEYDLDLEGLFIRIEHAIEYAVTGGVLTGSSRIVQEAREREDKVARQQEVEIRALSLER